jgi:hypothetical protein
MLRTLLISAALLTTSGTVLAHNDDSYGRVVSVEPHFAISFSSRHHDGFGVLYESGDARYWTATPYHPGHAVVLPPHYRVDHVHHHRDYGYGKDRRGWDDDRDGWRGDRRDHNRDHRRHGRD